MTKFISSVYIMVLTVGFLALANVSMAGSPPIIESFHLRPDNLVGETCNNQGGEFCARIDTSSFELVSKITVFVAKPGDIRVDFCPDYDDDDGNFLICRVLVDGNEAEPGEITFSTIDGVALSKCFSWYASVQGIFRSHMTEVFCRERDESAADVIIRNYTHSVFVDMF